MFFTICGNGMRIPNAASNGSSAILLASAGYPVPANPGHGFTRMPRHQEGPLSAKGIKIPIEHAPGTHNRLRNHTFITCGLGLKFAFGATTIAEATADVTIKARLMGVDVVSIPVERHQGLHELFSLPCEATKK